MFTLYTDVLSLEANLQNMIQSTQDYILLALEEHCSSRDSHSFQRYGKLLVTIASLKSLTQDALHHTELKKWLEAAHVNEELIEKLVKEQ